jgi:hypothetical protein
MIKGVDWKYLAQDRRNEALYRTGEFHKKLRNYRLLVVDSVWFVWLLVWIIN